MQREYAILRRFAEAFGPSAAEGEVADEIRAVLGKAFHIDTLPHGALVVRRRRRRRTPPRRVLMLQAHMDELGFRPFRYLPDGFIQVSPLSPLPDAVDNHPIRFSPGGKEGLLLVRKEGNARRYFLDVGVGSAEDAQREVPFHATGAYTSTFGLTSTEFVCKSFDDRAGCALIADALLDHSGEEDTVLLGVFTTREEMGSWPIPELVRHLIEAGTVPDLLINLEVCPGGPTPADPDCILTMGRGVGLVHMDRDYAAPADVCRFMVETAEAAGVPFQHVAMRDGGGELGTLAFGLGCRGYSLVIPGRYMHSPHSVITRHDFDAARAMIRAILARY